MSLIVQKYGGTSVKTLARIRRVAKRILETRGKGHDLVVVVSAMAGETDRLLRLAHSIAERPPARELDMLLATGEQESGALLAMTIHAMGGRAQSLTGPQAGIVTDREFTRARIVEIDTTALRTCLEQGHVAIVAGFQGRSPENDITTLGRGGSDTSAVALAARLNAELCEIYTDVEGVYTADPRVVPHARKIDRISHDEMLEMASLGAKVLQSRSVEFAKKYNVPLVVRSSFNRRNGTQIVRETPEMEAVVVRAITLDRNQAKGTVKAVPDRPGIAAQIFQLLAAANINVDMIVQNVGAGGLTDMSFTVSRSDLHSVGECMPRIVREVGAAGFDVRSEIAKVSIVGIGMRSHAGVAARAFQALAEAGVNIDMISTSEIKISCVVDADQGEHAVRVLHDAFGLAADPRIAGAEGSRGDG